MWFKKKIKEIILKTKKHEQTHRVYAQYHIYDNIKKKRLDCDYFFDTTCRDHAFIMLDGLYQNSMFEVKDNDGKILQSFCFKPSDNWSIISKDVWIETLQKRA